MKYLEDKGLNLGLLKNYLESMNVRRVCHEFGASFGGRMPHVASIVPGGCTRSVDVDAIMSAQAYVRQVKDFMLRAYVPDVLTVAAAFPEYWSMGRSPGNFLSYGSFDQDSGGKQKLFPRGVLLEGKLLALDLSLISEDVTRAHFAGSEALHPTLGETKPQMDKPGAYSWIKAPRYGGKVMEVGTLARILVGHAQGDTQIAPLLERMLAQVGRTVPELNSVMGRHFVRAVETVLLLEATEKWVDALRPGEPTAVPFKIPDSCQGVGLTEAARGALGHWLEVKGGKVHRYQCVVPTTWNASPKDASGVGGPIEQSLIGTPVADEANPIEAVRVIRSFDPCLACAVH